jgi:hypothetical protein
MANNKKAITSRGKDILIEKESHDMVVKSLSQKQAREYMEHLASIPTHYLFENNKDDRQVMTLGIKDLPHYFLEKLHELMGSQISVGLSRKLTFEVLGRTGTDLWDAEITSLTRLNEIMTAMPETHLLARYQGRVYRGQFKFKFQKKDYWNPEESLSLWIGGTTCNMDIILHHTGLNKHVLKDGEFPNTLREWVDGNPDLGFIDDHQFDFDMDEYDASIIKSTSRKLENQVIEYDGIAIKKNTGGFHWGPKYQDCFTDGRAVVEPILELDDDDYKHQRDRVEGDIDDELPFIRVFSLKLRRYIFVDIRYISEVQWDKDALGKLVLPNDMKGMLHKVFQSKADQRATDLIQGKGGGMVILANGSPGVGKTMTAEIFAEYTKKPLYTMEVGDLGINPQEVEASLHQIFDRVTKWNAVLLFDECDIFMYKRGNDLMRAGIVGIFLRLLDYYQGFLFLTSNRSEVIDEAFKSRITLSLDYPKLTPKSREEIWHLLLNANGIELSNGNSLQRVSERDLNGRQIRNAVLLIKTVHGNKVNADQVLELTKYIGVDNES